MVWALPPSWLAHLQSKFMQSHCARRTGEEAIHTWVFSGFSYCLPRPLANSYHRTSLKNIFLWRKNFAKLLRRHLRSRFFAIRCTAQDARTITSSDFKASFIGLLTENSLIAFSRRLTGKRLFAILILAPVQVILRNTNENFPIW